MKNVHGIIFSHSNHYNLNELIGHRCVGSVPFGGRYRLIDFTLSSMTNSDIEDVGVITQSNYLSLMDHVGSGREWDLSRKNGGLSFLPPFGNSNDQGFFRGNIEALANCLDYIRAQKAEYVLIAQADTVINIDYRPFIKKHIENQAEISVLYKKMTINDSRSSSVIKVAKDNYAQDMLIKPRISGRRSVLLNTMVINKTLLERMIEDCYSRNLFSMDRDIILPAIRRHQVYAYEYKGYVSNMYTMQDYFDSNMELLNQEVRHALFPSSRPVYTKIRDEAPVYFKLNSKTSNSFIADGCIIEGEVENSILFRGVHVKSGAKIKNSIVMQGSTIGFGANVEYIVADKNVSIVDGRNIIGSPAYPVFIKKGSVA